MENVLKPNKKNENFTWERLGNIEKGRGDLGGEMPVLVYRLMQYTLLDVLRNKHGEEQGNEYFREAGFLAGTEFAKNILDLDAELDTFLANLQLKLKDLKIGILRVELFDKITGEIVLTVAEDLDCSGIPVTDETVCYYDEGFISGILEVYTGKKYDVREIDCWANGDRVCRFRGVVE